MVDTTPPDKPEVTTDGLLALAPRDKSGMPMLGGIRLTQKLGQGGMGAVYRGHHPRLGVDVAVKVLPFHLASANANAVDYFMREARVAARLNHPNLVRIFDVNIEKEPRTGSQVYYLVMEFVAGVTAGTYIRHRVKTTGGPMTEADALDLVIAATDGLAAAHEENIIHRDIKPDNIIIPTTDKGDVLFKKAKLMDLGLAKQSDDGHSMGLTATNVAMGTPGYMSPEQAESAKEAGPPADVFSMGATLYTLLTGAAPFAGSTVLNILRKTVDEPHPPARSINPAVTEATEVLIDRSLAKAPADRFADATVLLEALRAARAGLAGKASPGKTLTTIHGLTKAPSKAATKPVTSKAPTKPPVTPATPSADAQPVPTTPVVSTSAPTMAMSHGAPWAIIGALVTILVLGAAGVVAWIMMKPTETRDDRIEKALARAFQAEARDAWEEAAAAYAEALAIKPDPETQKKFDAAKKKAQEAEAAKAKRRAYDEAIKAARDALGRGDWAEAEGKFLEAQKADDTDEVKQGLAKAREEKTKGGAYAEALQRASAAMRRRDWKGAEQAYQEALKAKPDSEEATKGLKEARARAEAERHAAQKLIEARKLWDKDAEGAWDAIRAGISVDGDNYELRMASGQLALHAERLEWYDDAIGDAKHAEKVAPSATAGIEAKALCDKLGREKEKESRLGPLWTRIKTSMDKDDWDDAERAVADAKRMFPRRPGYDRLEKEIEKGRQWQKHFDAGAVAEKRKDVAGAIREYQQAENVWPRPKSKLALERLETEKERLFQDALKRARDAGDRGEKAAFEKAIADAKALDPRRPEIADLEAKHGTAAVVKQMEEAFGAGRWTDALKHAEAVLQKEPAHARAKQIRDASRYHVEIDAAKAALQGGDRREALAKAKAAAALDPKGAELAELEKALWTELLRRTHETGEGPADEMVISRDGTRLIVAGTGYDPVAIWDIEALKGSVKLTRVGAGDKRCFAPVSLPRGRIMALYGVAGSEDRYEVAKIDAATGAKALLKLKISGSEYPFYATAMTVAPDGELMVRALRSPGGADGADAWKLDVFDPSDGDVKQDVGKFRGQGHALARTAPDREQLVTGGGTWRTWKQSGGRWVVDETKPATTLYFWTMPGYGQRIVELGADAGAITAMDFSVDGKFLAAGTAKGKLLVVDASSYQITARLEAGGEVASVSMAEGGVGVAVAGGKVVFFDAAKGAVAGESAAVGKAKCAAIAPDGKAVFAAGEDGRLRRFVFGRLLDR